MGTKYSSQSASGYNSSPPSDDGSTAATNRVSWATIKTKITDPIKTLADAINTALTTVFDTSARAITASDSAVAGDHDRVIQVNTASVSVTLADAATMAAGYMVGVHNNSSGNISVVRATGADTINGATKNIVLPAGQRANFRVNAAANGYLLENATGGLILDPTDPSKQAKIDVSAVTTGTVRTLTLPDFNVDVGITGLTEDTSPDRNADYFTTYDASAGGLKKVLLGRAGAWTSLGEVATTSGTSKTWTGIPAWATEIRINFVGVSLSGSSHMLFQLGDSGGVENTGYLGSGVDLADASAVVATTSTAGFIMPAGAAGRIYHGTIHISLEDSSDFTWTAQGFFGRSDGAGGSIVGGSKATSAVTDRVQIASANGSDTFDAGVANAWYR